MNGKLSIFLYHFSAKPEKSSINKKKCVNSVKIIILTIPGEKDIMKIRKISKRGVGNMTRVLLQGDSITDAGRKNVDEPNDAGCGYAMLVKSHLMMEDPDCVVYNCGISGNRSVDLKARWKTHCLDIEPDVLSVLVGTNDAYHSIFSWKEKPDGNLFEDTYREILSETRRNFPNVKFILMGSFLLHGTTTDGSAWGFERFYNAVKEKRLITKKLADEFDAEYIDLQALFDSVAEDADKPSRWSVDGVHPTVAGHELIKREWLKAYERITK